MRLYSTNDDKLLNWQRTLKLVRSRRWLYT